MQGPSGLWMAPGLGGLLLVLLGIGIIVEPRILIYAVALALIFGGLTLMGCAFAMRPRVSYHQVDP
jgi:hypothetical protein